MEARFLSAGDVFLHNNNETVCIDGYSEEGIWVTIPKYYNENMIYGYTSASVILINPDTLVEKLYVLPHIPTNAEIYEAENKWEESFY